MIFKWIEDDNMTSFLIGLCCFLGGGLVTVGAMVGMERRTDQTADIIQEIGKVSAQVAVGQLDVQKSLTETDLLAVPCSGEFIEANGMLLCREMWCRMHTVREGAASQKECESISNLINKAVIIEECSKLGDGYADCLELFDRRL